MILEVFQGVTGFEWDRANTAHIANHNVLPDEAEEVFSDKDNIVEEDVEHSTVEKRFLIIGKTQEGRLLYQIFTRRGNNLRVISSRDINRKEVALYEKEVSRTKV